MESTRPVRLVSAVSALLLCAASCTGAIGGDERPHDPAAPSTKEPGRADRPTPAVAVPPGPSRPGALSPAPILPGALRRLTAAQFSGSLRDLLGAAPAAELEPDSSVSGFAAVGAAELALSPRGVELYETAIARAVDQALADGKRRAALYGCTPSGPADRTCLEAFVAGFGLRAWRRPLTSAEKDRYVTAALALAARRGDFDAGGALVARALLFSPHFLYRAELGEVGPDGIRRLDPFELAARLSYLLWNTTPDPALLDAAASGTLGTDAGLAAAVFRLLASPRARDGLAAFTSELFTLDHVDTLTRDPVSFPMLTPALRQAMKGEVIRLFQEIALGGRRDLLDLFDTRDTFADRALAKLYGLSVSGEGLQPLALPESGMRRGILGTAAVLAMHSKQHDSSPTRRGRFIREVLLCQPVPDPPPEVADSLPPLPEGLTKRDLLAKHREAPSCAACHALMDPLGLGLEHFDALGVFRAKEGKVAIDASGELDGQRFSDAGDLSRRVREHPDVRACLVRSFVRYATGRADGEAERSIAEALAPALDAGGNSLRALVEALVLAPSFRQTAVK